MSSPAADHAILDAVDALGARIARVRQQIGRAIYGQQEVVDQTLITLLAGGHVLLVGVPGLGKSRLVETLGVVMGLATKRVQFTPDLMPADILGSEVLDEDDGGRRSFRFVPGPVFCQLLMADEINRASPRTQSALLQAMQERRVTVAGVEHPLPLPFHVLATQNPIEQEGTYPLPEAQLDRFMLMIKVGYPTRAEERTIMDNMTMNVADRQRVEAVASHADLAYARSVIGQIYIDDKIKDYIVDVVSATREPAAYGLKDLGDLIEYGASPRASIFLNMAARAHAFLKRRGYVTPEDIKAIGTDVLRHRVVLTYEAEAEEVSAEDVVRRIFERVEVP